MKTSVGIYEAKTQLAALLRQVATGKRFTITNRGKAAIGAFQAFRKANPVRQKVNIRELIEAGREWALASTLPILS